jgi:hypothetical protein
MSILLLVGLVQAEMDDNGFIHTDKGWIPKDQITQTKPIDYKPQPRKKRKYTR